MSDWDHRQLCADGSCVGVIGDDGTCKACGRAAPNWGEERKRGLIETDAHDGEADEDEGDDSDDDEDYEDDGDGDGDGEDGDAEDADGDSGSISASADTADGGGEWTHRTLCPDGGCVGLIGKSGACNVCGRSAA